MALIVRPESPLSAAITQLRARVEAHRLQDEARVERQRADDELVAQAEQQQNANGLAAAIAEPVKHEARIRFAKMLEREVQRVVRRRRELDLKNGLQSALRQF